jgi:hypothetical protein
VIGDKVGKFALAAAALLLFAVSISFPASAVNVQFQSHVDFIYPVADGSFVIGFIENSPDCSSIDTPTKYFYVKAGQNSVTAEAVRNMLAVALVAFTTEKPVRFAFRRFNELLLPESIADAKNAAAG